MNNQSINSKISTIKYTVANINEVKVKVLDKSKGKYTYACEFDGKPVIASQRFFNSLGSKFGINQNVFSYFTPDEFFERVVKKHGKSAKVRLAIEHNVNGNQGKLLAVSNPDSNIITYDEALQILQEKSGREIAYENGKILGMFHPESGGEQIFSIGGDEFRHEFLSNISVDGYGGTDISLALLRLACLNGMVAMSSAFKSPIKLGKEKPLHGLERAISTFCDESGYEVLVNRVETAQQTVASVAECQLVAKFLDKTGYNAGSASGVMLNFSKMCGSLCDFYGESSMDAFSARKQSLLPTKATVYDLLNFVTEVSTHHANGRSKTSLQGLCGSLLSREFDLEGFDNKQVKRDDGHTDLFLDNSRNIVERKRKLIPA